ncbi:MAG: hypothetical protein NT166_19220 [Candidatus Aminicenantes bacterium]|nr:hypothetical protein [Candidatus Aminicenantes bacterium]
MMNDDKYILMGLNLFSFRFSSSFIVHHSSFIIFSLVPQKLLIMGPL